MAQPVILAKQLAASSAANICAAQSGFAGTSLTLNGGSASNGVATLDTQRRVSIFCSANEGGNSFTVSGTAQGGYSISESVTGASGAAVATQQDFLTVTSIVPASNTSSGVTAGTNGIGSSPWQLFNYHITPPYLGLQFEVTSGSVTGSVEYTMDNFLAPLPIYSQAARAIPVPVALPSLQNVTSTADASINFPIKGWRLTVTSGTGAAQTTGIQAGIRN